jgi:hypothetical protein
MAKGKMKFNFIVFYFLACSLILSSFSFKVVLNSNPIGSTDSLFNAVVLKLKNDSNALKTCNVLYFKYFADQNQKDTLTNNYLDKYIDLYNTGDAFTRLMNKDKLDVFFKQLYNSPITHEEYLNHTGKYTNYNSDKDIGGENEQIYYFEEYLNKGYILPEGH